MLSITATSYFLSESLCIFLSARNREKRLYVGFILKRHNSILTSQLSIMPSAFVSYRSLWFRFQNYKARSLRNHEERYRFVPFRVVLLPKLQGEVRWGKILAKPCETTRNGTKRGRNHDQTLYISHGLTNIFVCYRSVKMLPKLHGKVRSLRNSGKPVRNTQNNKLIF